MAASSRSPLKSLKRDTTLYFAYILLVATLGPFQFGYHIAELNAPQSVITCEEKAIQKTALHARLPQCIPMSVDQYAVVTAILTLGGFIGALIAGPYCSKYGRLPAMRLMTAPFIIGPALECLATNVPMLAIGRLISGLGAGASLVVVPIYISETSPPDSKGLFGALTQIVTNLGIVITQTLGLFLSRGSLWRIIVAVPGAITVLMILALSLVPESPKWLAKHKHPDEARRILRKIRGGRTDLDEEVQAWNIDSFSEDISEEESLLRSHSPSHATATEHNSDTTSIGILSAFLHPNHRPGIIAVIGVMLAQQLTGINSIIMYSVHLLKTLLPTSAATLSVAISALNLIMTTLCAPLSDRIGRKTTLLISTAGMGFSSVLLAIGISSAIKPLAAASTLLFVTGFAVGLGPVPFILANELVSAEAVGATQSWALATNWIATFLVSQFFPLVNKALGENGRVYYIFAANALVLGAFIWWWVPETRGKSGADEVWGRKEVRERME